MKKIFTSFVMLLLTTMAAWSATVDVTYRYVHNGNVWYTETKQATVGEAYPEVATLPDGVKYKTMPTGTVTAATTFDIECVYTNKFFSNYISDAYTGAKWVYLTLNAGGSTEGQLQYVSGQSYISITSRSGSTTNAYQWAFVGNPFTGYKVVNRAAGSTRVLASPAVDTSNNTGGNTFPTMMTESSLNLNTYNKYWDITLDGKGFFMARHGETIYMNNRSGKLAYWSDAADGGSRFIPMPADIDLATAASLSTTKYYMFVNIQTGKALSEGSIKNINMSNGSSTDVYEEHCAVSGEAVATNHSAIWQVVKSGTGYKLKNYSSGRYLNTTPPEYYSTMASSDQKGYGLPATGANGANWYWPLQTDATGGVYYIAANADGYYALAATNSTTTGTVALGDDGYMGLPGYTPFFSLAQWELREVTPETAATITYATSITSGSYYRLVNKNYPDRAMSEVSGKVAGVDVDRSSYSQIWKVTKNGSRSTYSFQNALTGKYIQANPGTSTQFSTGSSAAYFTPHTSGSNPTYFAFDNNGSGYTAMHCDGYYRVVGWTYNSNASYWALEEVTLTQEELNNIAAAQAINNGTSTNYTSTLQTFFSDYACTTLKSTYQSYTDANLRTAMANAGLPSTLQEMAVHVKNNTWNTEEGTTWNQYEKDFRIHEYDIFSNCTKWYDITQIGPFARLTNPTGIQAKAGDILYILVNDNVQDSDASLEVECVVGTDRTGTTKTLTRGCNAVFAPADCEIFISYILNNTSKSCNSYPNIKIQVAGGTCNGFFDMQRGHTNNDWAWLKDNMFSGEYLHVKGNSVLLNVTREGVINEPNAVGVMNIWDFIFDTEESFAGCDQWKSTGRYKMMINSFHNPDNPYPHWGSGNHGTSHPDLTSNGCFNYNNLANSELWEIAHEMGHAHQGPILAVGTDEVSNNVMSQIIQFLAKDNIENNMFQSAKTSRGNGVKTLLEDYNNGYSYIDYARRRMIERGEDGYTDNIANRWLFQLWMYYDYLGHYQPTGGNNGFAFISALYNKLRSSGLSSTNNIATPNTDYLKLAQYCAEIVQEDLSEFFEVWGFWKTAPKFTGLTVHNEDSSKSETDSGTTYYVGGYTIKGINMSSAASQVSSVKSTMQSYSTKANNIIFIEDRGVDCTLSTTYDGLNPQTMGDVGYYGNYSNTISGSYEYAIDGTTVTVSGGTGAVGYKIYDGSGNLVAVSNMNTFSVPAAVASGLSAGTYTLVAAQGDGTDVATIKKEPEVQPDPELFAIQSWRSYGFVKYNGDDVAVTQTLDFSDENTRFYFVPVNGTSWADGVKIVSNVSGKQLVDVGTGFADSGTTWYIKENPYKAGFYCISKTSDLTSGCWDCNAAGAMSTGYWAPSSSDNDGTSWQIVSVDDLPRFQTSTLAEPKWYYIQSGRDNRYLYADGTNAGTNTSNLKTDAYKFAFISTGNNGIQVVSKAGLDNGSNQYLSTAPGLSSTASTWYYYNAARSNGRFMLAIEELEQNWTAQDYFGYLKGDDSWVYRLLHIDASGNLVKWYGSGDANTYWVEEVPEESFEVTYNVVYNGNIIATGAQIHAVGDEPSMPSGMDYAFTTFAFDVSEITSSTRTVNATATFNMPFETSTNYDGAKWYYMHGHASWSTKYISTNGDATVWGDGNSRTDAYQWAFIGNPVEGIKVINKAAGSGKYLMGTDPATMGTTAKVWVLKQQTNTTWQSGDQGFGLYDATLTYLNTQGTTLKYWWQFDQGSTYWVEEVPEDYSANVEDEIKPWFETYGDGYFQLKSSVVEANRSKYEAALVSCDLATYEELTALVSTAANFILPEAGTYRIKSYGARNAETYMAYNEGLVTVAAANKLTDRTTVMELTGSNGTYKISIPYVGLNVQAETTHDTKFPATSATGVDFQFMPIVPGYAAIINQDSYVNTSFAGALHEAGGATPASVVNWNAAAEASLWSIEDAEYYGDADGNGVVDAADIPSLVDMLVGRTDKISAGDVNRNGQVTLADLTALINFIRNKNN